MGLFDRLSRRRPQERAESRDTRPAQAKGFAVLDVETTGLSAARERIVEIAIVRVDCSGAVVDEWTTLIDPERASVGATHVHGISAEDVMGAPTFDQVAGAIIERLDGWAVVAHNASFDLQFLAAELARAGLQLPPAPHLCTLQASWDYLPAMSRRTLAECCAAAGVSLEDAHSALGDARATAALLQCYLNAARDERDGRLRELAASAADTTWPVAVPTSVPLRARAAGVARPAPAPVGRLAQLLAGLPLDSADLPLPDGSAYLELLTAVMADGVLTEDEANSLADHAHAARLTHAQVTAAHRGVLLALAREAVADGKVTAKERAELLTDAAALGLEADEVRTALGDARAEREHRAARRLSPLPSDWSHGEPLRLGQRVVFTGGDNTQRKLLERRTADAGLRVTSSVSRLTALLVTDDPHSGTRKAEAAAQLGVRVVSLATYAQMLEHVQPDGSQVRVEDVASSVEQLEAADASAAIVARPDGAAVPRQGHRPVREDAAVTSNPLPG